MKNKFDVVLGEICWPITKIERAKWDREEENANVEDYLSTITLIFSGEDQIDIARKILYRLYNFSDAQIIDRETVSMCEITTSLFDIKESFETAGDYQEIYIDIIHFNKEMPEWNESSRIT